METAIFRCDFCGVKAEEEFMGWRRPRCSVELVLRGRRFVSSASASLYGVPFSAPPPIATANADGSVDPATLEDERWASSLCDRCMQRIAALLGMKLETPEEVAAREAHVAERAVQEVIARDAEQLGLRGEMVSQFPTPLTPPGVTPLVDDKGGMVAQYPTQEAGVPGYSTTMHHENPSYHPEIHGSDARAPRKSERRKGGKKTKRSSGGKV